MTVMRQVQEVRAFVTTYRVLACDCGQDDCTGFAVVGSHDALPGLWATLGSASEDGLGYAVARLQEGELEDTTLRVCALVGCSFRRLDDPTAVAESFEAWRGLPDWMFAMRTSALQRARRGVFGDPWRAVPAALEARAAMGSPGEAGGHMREQDTIGLASMTLELDFGSLPGWQG